MTGVANMNGDGTYTYSYTVDNLLGLFDTFSWSLEFGIPDAQIDWNRFDVLGGGDVIVPLGNTSDPLDDWSASAGVPTFGLTAQDFTAIDPLGSGDVLTGESLGGFSFTSSHPPGTVTYFEFGPFGDFASGETVGPVPEAEVPILMVVAGSLLSLGFRRRARSLHEP